MCTRDTSSPSSFTCALATYAEVFEEMFLSNYLYEITCIYKKYQRWIHYPGDKTEFDFSSEDLSSYGRYQFYCLCSELKL